ncbi:MAG: DUF349 domain-containing protein [Bacteroidota bacterium]|nr:DUF349 domain-containing protein [Bacteroidota bacterium]
MENLENNARNQEENPVYSQVDGLSSQSIENTVFSNNDSKNSEPNDFTDKETQLSFSSIDSDSIETTKIDVLKDIEEIVLPTFPSELTEEVNNNIVSKLSSENYTEENKNDSTDSPVKEVKDFDIKEVSESENQESEKQVEEKKSEGNSSLHESGNKETVVSENEINEKPQTENITITTESVQEEENDLGEHYNKFSKEELVNEIESLVEKADLNKTKVSYIKVAFYKLLKSEKNDSLIKFLESGGKKEDYSEKEDPHEERFKKAFNIYKEKKAKYDEELEKQKIQNLQIKRGIIDELKKLVTGDETIKKTYDEFKALQQKWKECGPVPQNEINDLWQSYHHCVEQFFDFVKINKELKDLDLKKNLESKIKLCEKIEELLIEKSINKSFKQLQEYKEDWREIGPVPSDKNDEIWERFRSAIDKLNEKRLEHYNKIRDEQVNNYNAKTALCEKVEQIADMTYESQKVWNEKTNEVNEIQKMWKTIGFAPKKVNDEIWERFKSSLDKFYNTREEFFKKQKEEQVNNMNLKIALCVQAEAIVNNTNWKEATNDLINLQKEWKKIGPVNPRQTEKLWKRFRHACDEFFDNKAKYYENIDQIQIENLQKKQAIVIALEELVAGDEHNLNFEEIKNYQREWMEIGHVPLKEKDKIQNEFKSTIDKLWVKLKVNSVEVSNMGFRSKFENIKNAPNANKVIGNERNFIQNKINSLKSDIQLWENNIGFFAHSAKADELKKDFELKIKQAKEELLKLEDKLKFLSQL